jgi:hypothetical protein
MAQHPLDRIIIRANADTQPHDGGKIVMIDRKTKTRLLKKPPSWGFWKDVDYFLVFRESVKREGLTHDIDDFENDRTIQIQIDYQATCLQNREEEVVVALYDSDTLPSVVLENKIIGWVKAFTTRWEREFIDNYQEKIKELQNNMEKRAEREVFLSIKFRLTSNIQLPSSLLIGPQKFSVQVTDYPKNLDCEVDGELGVLDQKTAHNRRDRLEAIVEREIKSYMAKYVKLHDYYFGSDEQLIPGIKTYLDGVFASQGRQVERLFIKREKPSFSNDVREVTKEVKYQVQERSEPVTIVSTLQMELQDAGQYVATGTPNLEKWVQRELDNIIPRVLFGMKYIDLLLSFQPKEADIKDYMEKQAKSIGYSLRALLSVPNLEQLKLLKNFDIDVPGTQFPTKIDQAEVKLEISVTVRIQNLKDIEIYLNQQQDVKQLMREAILNETKRFLRSIEPEGFYMRFGFTVEGEKGVEQNLIELLTEKLSNEFKATVIKVDLKRLNTDITDRLRELEKSLPEGFEFEISPLSGGEPIVFYGDFQVEGVDPNGWYQFQKRTFSIQHIRDHIQKTAQRKLRTFASEHLEYRWHEEQEDIQKAMAHIMRQSAIEVFGVAIRVLNFDRKMTELDKQRNKLRRELEKKKLLRLEREMEDKQERQDFEKELKKLTNESDKKRYKQLLTKREEIIEDGLIDDDEELADLEAEILEKSKTTDENKSNEDELLRELDALEDSRPRKTRRSRELLTRITQNEGTEKALPGATSTSEVEEVENLPKSKNGVEGETHIDGDIADAEVISFNKPAQPPLSENTGYKRE